MERRIIIGLITSTSYIKQVRQVLQLSLFEADMARILANWCYEYFDEYKRAPIRDIQSIYEEALHTGQITEDLAEDIAEDILPSLADEFENLDNFNVEYLVDKTLAYIEENNLNDLQNEVDILKEQGKMDEAKQLLLNYRSKTGKVEALDLGSEAALEKVRLSFDFSYQSVVEYPGALGEFWNRQMVRGGFVSLMAPEKRGKTFLMMDMVIRAARQGAKVAFIQAGDMTEAQQLQRICVHLTKLPTHEKYCGEQWFPVKDCKLNQLDECTKSVRESSGYLWDEEEEMKKATFEDLVAIAESSDYSACHNCTDYEKNAWGVPYLEKRTVKGPIDEKIALRKYEAFFIKHKRHVKLATYPNGSLGISELNSLLDTWEMNEDFVPDLLVLDYADLLTAGGDFRNAQNQNWKGLRAISQSKHCLLVTATQTDARSYSQHTLSLSNFSEDKRKFAHVTAMYGMNQDPEGVEKKIGLLRLNEILLRDGEFDSHRSVTLLQKLSIGKPLLTSYFPTKYKQFSE